MYSFYLVRGHSKKELEKLTYLEKIFYFETMLFHEKNEAAKFNSLFGGGN